MILMALKTLALIYIVLLMRTAANTLIRDMRAIAARVAKLEDRFDEGE